jgi:hypothetical protein
MQSMVFPQPPLREVMVRTGISNSRIYAFATLCKARISDSRLYDPTTVSYIRVYGKLNSRNRSYPMADALSSWIIGQLETHTGRADELLAELLAAVARSVAIDPDAAPGNEFAS